MHDTVLWSKIVPGPHQRRYTISISTSRAQAVTCKYLGGLLNVRNIGTYPERPLNMDLILIKLQQKHDQNKQSIEHQERENWLITQLYKLFSNPGL